MNLKRPIMTTVAAVTGSMLAMAALVSAQGATLSVPDNPPSFEKIDKNHDGAVSMTEAKDTWLAAAFSSVDANGDGSISKPEYVQAVS